MEPFYALAGTDVKGLQSALCEGRIGFGARRMRCRLKPRKNNTGFIGMIKGLKPAFSQDKLI
jgi:hypothetical protein